MITGDIEPTEGDVFVHGLSIRNNPSLVYRHLGFCSQQNSALYDLMSAREVVV
jgi:ABC-type multidrug transport system ATPase subunit